MTKKKYAYCKYCKKSIENPRKKPMDSLYYTIWLIVIISTLGIALIPFLIIYKLKKKIYCPQCHSVLEFYDTKEQLPDKRPALEHIFDKIEEDKKQKEQLIKKEEIKEKIKKQKEKKKEIIEEIHCPYCHKVVENNILICPYCGVEIKTNNIE
jgi:uncharacterized paraquat-inducible protein A